MATDLMCVILGGGGHARVLIDCLRMGGAMKPAAILDPNRDLWGKQIDDVPVLGDDEELPRLLEQDIRAFAVGLGQGPRAHLFERTLQMGFRPVSAIHPRAVVSARASIDDGAQIFACAVVNAGAVLGKNVIVNTAAVVEHDCVIGDHVHVSCNACLAGGVQVEAGAFVGAGSTIRQGLKIGALAVVGAGAVVTKDVAPGQVVAGVPARQLR